jgi:hypothetical protein
MSKNGIWQLSRLVFQYSKFGGSSRGARFEFQLISFLCYFWYFLNLNEWITDSFQICYALLQSINSFFFFELFLFFFFRELIANPVWKQWKEANKHLKIHEKTHPGHPFVKGEYGTFFFFFLVIELFYYFFSFLTFVLFI